MTWSIEQGDCLDVLRGMDAESVQTCVTSPPYWGLRDYGSDGQLGLEPTPEQYVENLVAVFREVRRVLRDDGTVWLNLGDSYYATTATQGRNEDKSVGNINAGGSRTRPNKEAHKVSTMGAATYRRKASGLKPKDLVGIPWMVAFALRADGWYLRSDIIWAKPNPMPESVTDRPTKAHEYLFLLSKSPRYFYDADAIREELGYGDLINPAGRNRRSVWTVTTQPFPGAHFATFPPKLIEPCILAGSPPKCCGECGAPRERVRVDREIIPTKDAAGPATDARTITAGTQAQRRSHGATLAREPARTLGWRPACDHDDDSGRSLILDPFAGAGTTGVVALRHDRSFVGIELNPEYAEMARNRIRDDAPLLNVGLEAA